MRLHGVGRPVQQNDDGFEELLATFDVSDEQRQAVRSVVTVDVTRVGDSCGFVVPRMQLVEERDQLFRWAEHQQRSGGGGWKSAYERTNNTASIDGLTGLDLAGEASAAEQARYRSEGRAI